MLAVQLCGREENLSVTAEQANIVDVTAEIEDIVVVLLNLHQVFGKW
jgi:hypothetical protein